MSFRAYWSRFGKKLFADAYTWARDNIFWGLLVLILPALIVHFQHRDFSVDWHLIVTTLYAYAGLLVVYLVVHAIRTPWKLDSEKQKELDTANEIIRNNLVEIERLKWPENYPVIRFISWGQNPETNSFKQAGFSLSNSGNAPALEILVEPFKVGTDEWMSKVIAGVDQGKDVFALVWKTNGNKFNRFDLLEEMQNQAGPAGMYGPDYTVPVSLIFRDSKNRWYRGQANLAFIRSQGRLTLGPTTIEKYSPPISA